MSPKLLPASAAAFEPRASTVKVVLNSQVEPWLTQILRRICCVEHPLITIAHHQKFLAEKLSLTTAIWTLTSLMMPRAPFAELSTNPNPLVEALSNYQIIHLEAYIVHVDLVSQNEVAFKLTSNSIDALVKHHKHVHCVDLLASISAESSASPQWRVQVENIHADFVQAVNKFIYRTHASALENLEKDGSGELSSQKSEDVKRSIMSFFQLPPTLDHKLFNQNPTSHKPQIIESSCLSASPYFSYPKSVDVCRESFTDSRSRSNTEINEEQPSLPPHSTQLYSASVIYYQNPIRFSDTLSPITPSSWQE